MHSEFVLIALSGPLQTILSIVGALLGLGIVVFVHEIGHFIIARRTGIKIEAFSIGFGPVLWHKEKDGVDYRFSAIFCGGYVKLAGMESKGDVPVHEIPGGFYAANPKNRSITAFAGAAMNFIFAFLVFTLLWGTGRVVDKRELSTIVGYLEPGYPAAEAGIIPGDKIIEIDGREIKEWKDVLYSVAFAEGETTTILIERDEEELAIELRPKLDKDMGARRVRIVPERPVIVRNVNKNSVAEKIGLEKDDKVIAVLAGEKTTAIHYIPTFRETLKENVGREITLKVLRETETVELSVVVPEPEKGVEYPILGFELGFEKALKRVDPFTALWEVVEMVYDTLNALFKGSVKAKGLAGPVGLVNIIGLTLLSHWTRFLYILAFISLNLAIVNLLPIPVLDGGHILFSLVEAVRKKPVSEKVMAVVTNVFAGIIILFFLYVTSNDIMRIVRRGKDKDAPAQEEIQKQNSEGDTVIGNDE